MWSCLLCCGIKSMFWDFCLTVFRIVAGWRDFLVILKWKKFSLRGDLWFGWFFAVPVVALIFLSYESHGKKWFFRPNGITEFSVGNWTPEFQNPGNNCCVGMSNIVQPNGMSINNVLHLTFNSYMQASRCWLTGKNNINLYGTLKNYSCWLANKT